MATWNSRGLRGSGLEDLINRTNESYQNSKLCLIQKIPTPITPIDINHDTRQITLAYFDKKSTVDYIGVVQGIPVCFDAKESKTDTFPLQNVHQHQVDFMKGFENQQGIAFLIIFFTNRNTFYYMRCNELMNFWERALDGGRKSVRYDELDKRYFFESRPGALVPYLNMIQQDLDDREYLS